MGGSTAKKQATNKNKASKQNKKSVILKKSSSVSTKKKCLVKTKVKASAKTEKKAKKPKFTYESLILDHRENGRKLARSILRKWRVHMPGEEVDSIVDLALCESAQRFSPKKGASFMTFFFYHLRGHLVRAVARATQNSAIINGPKSEEWCGDEHLEFASNYGAYLDNEIYNQRDNETPEQLIIRREKIQVCREAINKLDTLEKMVLDKSYAEDEALVDIAKSLGYSRCHISRVKKGALIRLKSVLEHSPAITTSALKKAESAKSDKKLVVLKLDKKTRRKKSERPEIQSQAA